MSVLYAHTAASDARSDVLVPAQARASGGAGWRSNTALRLASLAPPAPPQCHAPGRVNQALFLLYVALWVALFFTSRVLLALSAALAAMYFLGPRGVPGFRWLDDHLAPALTVAAALWTLSEIAVTWRERMAPVRALPAWETSVSRWNRLFYCFQCDGVFFPHTGVLVEPNRMDTLLSREPQAVRIWQHVHSSLSTPAVIGRGDSAG